MDENRGKRAAGRLGFSRKGTSLCFRDSNHEDRSIHYCSRLGRSTRPNFNKGTQVSNYEAHKCLKASFRSTSSNALAESSSTSFCTSSDIEGSHQERQNRTSFRGVVDSSSRQGNYEELRCVGRQELIEDHESSSRIGRTGDLGFSSEPSFMRTIRPNSEEYESVNLQGFPENVTEGLESCTTASTSRTCKQTDRTLGFGRQDSPSSSERRSFVSRSTTLVAKSVSQGIGVRVPRYGLKNLGCTSISGVFSGCSFSEVGRNKRVNEARKRLPDGEVSTGSTSGPSSERNSGSSHSRLSDPSLEHPSSQPNSRRARNQPTSRDGSVSVRTRRRPAGETRGRLHEEEENIDVSLSETIVVPPLPQTRFSIPEVAPESSLTSLPSEPPHVFRNTFGRSGITGHSFRNRSSSDIEDTNARVFRNPLRDRYGDRRFNMEGVADVLLALERIEQDNELTYEQLLVLERNLLLGGPRLHDRHRDMRLDIDNMSYEDLLALEEKMGTVSTALSEEALEKCLKRSIYSPASIFLDLTCGDDDIKCSICQEEYAIGDEVGKLACKHCYHVSCANQWLRQKNWCPICKVPACPS